MLDVVATNVLGSVRIPDAYCRVIRAHHGRPVIAPVRVMICTASASSFSRTGRACGGGGNRLSEQNVSRIFRVRRIIHVLPDQLFNCVGGGFIRQSTRRRSVRRRYFTTGRRRYNLRKNAKHRVRSSIVHKYPFDGRDNERRACRMYTRQTVQRYRNCGAYLVRTVRAGDG